MIETSSPEPRKIGDILQKHSGLDIVGDAHDEERAVDVRRRDSSSEVRGLSEDISDIEADMARTGDPNLADARDAATQASMEAQKELREL